MSLADLNENAPLGSDPIDRGAFEIRITRREAKDTILLEHYPSGEHRFPGIAGPPLLGALGLSGPRLMYGTGTEWKASSFNAEGATGGMATWVQDTVAWTEVLAFNTTFEYTTANFWATAMVSGEKPVATNAGAYNVGLFAPYPTLKVGGYTLILFGAQNIATEYGPINIVGQSTTSIPLGTRVSFMIQPQYNTHKLFFRGDAAIVLISAV